VQQRPAPSTPTALKNSSGRLRADGSALMDERLGPSLRGALRIRSRRRRGEGADIQGWARSGQLARGSAASAAGCASGVRRFREQHIRPCEYVCIDVSGLKLAPGMRLLMFAKGSKLLGKSLPRAAEGGWSMLAHAAFCARGVPRCGALHCTARPDDRIDRPTAHLALPQSRPRNSAAVPT